MRSQRIPDTDSIEELASFWDTHDLTDFEDELEEVRTPVFTRRKEDMVAITLTPKEARELKRVAQLEGVKEEKLLRAWIREKLRESSSGKPPNSYEDSPVKKTKIHPTLRKRTTLKSANKK